MRPVYIGIVQYKLWFAHSFVPLLVLADEGIYSYLFSRGL